MSRVQKVSRIFSRAAQSYDQQAVVQDFVARRLALRVLHSFRERHSRESGDLEQTPNLGTVLEVGCGTGILPPHLLPYCSQYVLSDFGYPLLQKAMEKVQDERVFPLVMDAEHPCFSASFDLIVSNLALHWFQNPESALAHWVACLKPGGWLYLSTLGGNTLHEWRSVHALLEAPCGLLDFVSFGQLKNGLPLSGVREVQEEWLVTRPQNTLSFLRGLRALGETSSHSGHRPLPYTTFRKVMALYDVNPQTSYQILFAVYQKPKKMREE